jgi:hypothetical protein
VARTLKLLRNRAVGFIDRLGLGGTRKLDVVLNSPTITPAYLTAKIVQKIASDYIVSVETDKTVGIVREGLAKGGIRHFRRGIISDCRRAPRRRFIVLSTDNSVSF